MTDTGALRLTASGEREILMTRVFDAPRRLIYDAYTKPELLKRWMLGPDGWSMPVCEIDLKVGGKYRYLWRHDESGREMGIGGVYRELAPPERIVSWELMDGLPRGAVITTVLTEREGMTTLTSALLFESRQDRDAALKSGMERGIAASYNRLVALLPNIERSAETS